MTFRGIFFSFFDGTSWLSQVRKAFGKHIHVEKAYVTLGINWVFFSNKAIS